MSIELYWGSGSVPARRVQLALALKNVPHESRLLSFSSGDTRKPEFLALNPRGKVPTIRDGSYVLSESLAILEWLDAKFPEPPLFGRTPEQRGEIWRQCLDEQNHFDPVVRASVRHIVFGNPTEKAAEIAAGLPALHQELKSFERRVAKGPMVGDTLSAADLVWFCALAFIVRAASRPAAEPMGLGILPLADHYPGLLAWARRIEAIPGYDATFPPHWLEGDRPTPRRMA